MKTNDLIIMALVCIFWGLDFIFAKQALEILNPLFFTAMRFFIISFALFPFVRKKIFNEIPILFLAGFMIVIVSYGASDISNKLNNSTMVSATLSQMDAILAILMGFFIFREEITYNKIIGVTIAFIGLMSMFIINVFSSQETSNLNSEIQGINWKNLISILITIVGITGCSGYIFFTKRIEEKMTNSEIIAWSSFFGSILCFIILIIFDGFQSISLNIKNINSSILFSILYSGFLGILIPNFLWHLLIKKHDISKLNTFVLLVPIIAIIGTAIFLNQEINIFIVLSIILIVLGIFIANIKRKYTE